MTVKYHAEFNFFKFDWEPFKRSNIHRLPHNIPKGSFKNPLSSNDNVPGPWSSVFIEDLEQAI